MRYTNSLESYGLVNIALHWLTVVAVLGLYGLGLWMEDLDYYHPWYHRAPSLHKGIGTCLTAIIIFRLGWRLYNLSPAPLANHKAWEKTIAKWVHRYFYIALLLMFPTGYFTVTADGKAFEVFDWFKIPSIVDLPSGWEAYMIRVHKLIADSIIVLFFLHSGGALKHHFIDRDTTLKRMIKIR